MASFQLYQDPLVSCPFNPAHRLKKSRMQIHLVKCRKDYEEQDLKVCPFNAQHRIKPADFQYHISDCPDRLIVERHIVYKSGEHQGNTTVPAYKTEAVSDGDFWDEIPSTRAGYVPQKKEIKGKPADRRKQYKDLFAAAEEYKLNGGVSTTPTPPAAQIDASPIVSPELKEIKPMRKPKATPEELLMQNGLGRGGVPSTRRKIAANIFGTPPVSQPPQFPGLGRGLSIGGGLGRGLATMRLDNINHPPLAPGKIQYLED